MLLYRKFNIPKIIHLLCKTMYYIFLRAISRLCWKYSKHMLTCYSTIKNTIIHCGNINVIELTIWIHYKELIVLLTTRGEAMGVKSPKWKVGTPKFRLNIPQICELSPWYEVLPKYYQISLIQMLFFQLQYYNASFNSIYLCNSPAWLMESSIIDDKNRIFN